MAGVLPRAAKEIAKLDKIYLMSIVLAKSEDISFLGRSLKMA